ncbi:MAG: tRNA (adenosine(37)-N6)-threonylcarbamoyltransferase complex ATPase subunit type 1 TsaE [Thermoleophilia bacterium]
MLTATLTSPEATGAFARLLAARLAPPALVTLRGELGTGKTTLVRDVLRALGVERVVASPSFTLAQSYEGDGGLRLHHLDLYRLAPGADAALFAWEDYLDGSSLAFVEWPEAGAAELPPADVEVVLRHRTPRSRELELRAAPGVEEALAGEMTAAGIEGVMLAPGVPPAAPGDVGDDDGGDDVDGGEATT